jgi:hypothetical protein
MKVSDTDPMKRYTREVKSHLEVVPSADSTYVTVLAVHKDPTQNFVRRVSAKRGVPVAGYGYVYDMPHECYLVRCVDFLGLGYVPLSFRMAVKGVTEWTAEVPMPESVLKKALSPQQRKDLKKFMSNFRENYTFEFIQLLA